MHSAPTEAQGEQLGGLPSHGSSCVRPPSFDPSMASSLCTRAVKNHPCVAHVLAAYVRPRWRCCRQPGLCAGRRPPHMPAKRRRGEYSQQCSLQHGKRHMRGPRCQVACRLLLWVGYVGPHSFSQSIHYHHCLFHHRRRCRPRRIWQQSEICLLATGATALDLFARLSQGL